MCKSIFWSIEGKRAGEKRGGWEGRRRRFPSFCAVEQRQSDDRGRVDPVSGDHPQESLLLIHAAANIGESPSLIMKCVFAEAHAAVQLLLESLCLSTPLSSLLPLFFRSDHSREAMSCFIHRDASPTVLNPSLSLFSGSESLANFNKFV